ncbi:MAG TPA: hypothetical protein PLN03_12840 [Spirochaetota bacterium]|nr:hypothetical protein [Spirochaetota bacterium]HOK93694.1 hypothetical protein [Spirochaetota bacterium]HRU66753.1 hypothetical protein [Spirochaetota bacterium]
MDYIIITVKLYSNLDKELKIKDYNPDKGIILQIKKGSRLGKILKKTGLSSLSKYAIFSDGERISKWKKFHHSAEISILKISGGG